MITASALHPIQSQYKFDSLSKILNAEIIKEIGKFWEHILEYNYSKKIGRKVNKILTLMVNSAMLYSEDYDTPVFLTVNVNTKTITIKLSTKIKKENYEFLNKIITQEELKETVNLAVEQHDKHKDNIFALARLGLDYNCKINTSYNKDNELIFKSIINI